jgi:hypothetical protein
MIVTNILEETILYRASILPPFSLFISPYPYIFLRSAYYSVLKMEAEDSFETLVTIYKAK